MALLTAEAEELKVRATSLLSALSENLPEDLEAQVVATQAQVGGGSLPGGTIDSYAIRLTPHGKTSAQRWQKRLRDAETPIIVRLEKECLYLDFRSLPKSDDEEVLSTFRKIFT